MPNFGPNQDWSDFTNLMNNYSKYSPIIKNKYLSICKTKIKDRYGEHIFRHTILDYPDHKDKSFSEEEEFSKHGKISFGDCKGQPINDLTKEQVLYYVGTRKFTLSKNIREAFLKSKHKDLVKDDSYYASLKKKKRTKRKKKRTKRKSKSKKILLCFTMKGCHWCHEFEKDLWPKLKKLNLCSFKIIEREKNP